MVAATRSAPPAATDPTTMTMRRAARGIRSGWTCRWATLTCGKPRASLVSIAARGRHLTNRGRLGKPGQGGTSGPTPHQLLVPALKHEDVPQPIRPIAPTAEVFQPLLPDGCRLQKAFASQARFIQERLGPVTQRAPQPDVDRDAE